MGKRTGQKAIVRRSRGASRMTWFGVGLALVAMLAVGAALFAGRTEESTQAVAAASPSAQAADGAVLPVVEVYKDPTCRCCSKWVDHLEENGFTVRTTDTRDLAAFKASHGVPSQVQSCHTALVGGYVVEGHVPETDVRRLLDERPAIAGLGVPGMPIGSPGMEVAGAPAQPYDVMAFEEDGSSYVFAAHR